MLTEEKMRYVLDKTEAEIRRIYCGYGKPKQTDPEIRFFDNSGTPAIKAEFGWDSQAQRQFKIDVTRMFLRTAPVSAYLIIQEAWRAECKSGESPSDPGFLPPSERDDRTEVILLMLCTRESRKMWRTFDIVRGPEAEILDIKRQTDLDEFNAEGTLATLFPNTDDPA
jgi:hypothetical protein